MHPILARKGWLGQYLAACTPIGVGLLLLFGKRAGFTFLEAAALAVPMQFLYAFLALSEWHVCQSVRLSPATAVRALATHAGAAAVTSGLWVLAGAALCAVLDWVTSSPVTAASRYASQVPLLFAAGVVLGLLSAVLHYAFLFFEASREEELQEAERKILAREAELSALKAQFQPHFLFNSLNSISALTSSDPGRAREMCVSLADFLRKSLAVEERESIPMAEELALARSYLDVERVRFGDRLRVEEDIAPESGSALVPPLLLQPLVENAVRHGIGTLVEGGVVRIEVGCAGHRVRIVVSNPFDPGAAPSTPSGGLGLSLVRDRLQAAFGGDAMLATRSLGGTHLTILSLPARRAA